MQSLKAQIAAFIEQQLDSEKYYLLEFQEHGNNVFQAFVESFTKEHYFDLEQAVSLTRLVNETFDRDQEDFELSLSSAGLDLPFRSVHQYHKYKGDTVDVLLKAGAKLLAVTLLEVTEEGITISYETKEKLDGKKRPELVKKEEFVNFSELKETRKTILYK